MFQPYTEFHVMLKAVQVTAIFLKKEQIQKLRLTILKKKLLLQYESEKRKLWPRIKNRLKNDLFK